MYGPGQLRRYARKARRDNTRWHARMNTAQAQVLYEKYLREIQAKDDEIIRKAAP